MYFLDFVWPFLSGFLALLGCYAYGQQFLGGQYHLFFLAWMVWGSIAALWCCLSQISTQDATNSLAGT